MTYNPHIARFTTLAGAAAFALACKGTDKNETAQATTDSAAMGATVAPAANAPAVPNDQMTNVLTQLASLGGKPIETLTPAEARKQPTPTDAVKAVLGKDGKSTLPDADVKSRDMKITGPGGSLPVRVYMPKDADAKNPLPVIVYYHGGGWVIANKDVYDAGPRALSKMANAIVVSVDYRLAPEAKFPAAHDDAIATYKWALANAASIGGDPKRVALAGESAGGNMAVATAIAARDMKLQMPVGVLAVYPVASTDLTAPSMVENANAKPLNVPMLKWFMGQYLNKPEEAQDPRLNLVAANLAGLPMTTIITAQIDPLRSGGAMLADKLKAAGVPVEYQNYEGVTHEFFGMGAVVDKAKDAEQFGADNLKKAFDKK